jgi:predicted TPR repeat methyltransferase
VGVDLSAAMLEKARDHKIYDELHCGELTEWLGGQAGGGEPFDLITCCDTLIYFGNLTTVVPAVMARLKPGGVFGFTLEKSSSKPVELGDSGRFRHSRGHVAEVAGLADAKVLRISEKVLRVEYGEEVTGLVTILQKITRGKSHRAKL